jgi:hypothetical protein
MFNRRQEVVANLIAFIDKIELEACEALARQEGIQETAAGKLMAACVFGVELKTQILKSLHESCAPGSSSSEDQSRGSTCKFLIFDDERD